MSTASKQREAETRESRSRVDNLAAWLSEVETWNDDDAIAPDNHNTDYQEHNKV